jgi:hypothetical protein
VVGANFEGLVTSHNEASLAVHLVLEEPERASATLSPLARLLDKLEHLASHAEDLFLRFLMCNGLDLLGEFKDGFEVNIFGLGGLFLMASMSDTPEHGERGPGNIVGVAHFIIALGGSGSLALRFGAARYVAAVLSLILLLFLCATTEHGENR